MVKIGVGGSQSPVFCFVSVFFLFAGRQGRNWTGTCPVCSRGECEVFSEDVGSGDRKDCRYLRLEVAEIQGRARNLVYMSVSGA